MVLSEKSRRKASTKAKKIRRVFTGCKMDTVIAARIVMLDIRLSDNQDEGNQVTRKSEFLFAPDILLC